MKGLPGSLLKCKTFRSFSNNRLISKSLFRSFPSSCHSTFIRSTHNVSRKFEGPSFRDFLISEKKNPHQSAVENDSTNDIPYLDDLDLNGRGRKVLIEVQGCQMNFNDTEIVWSILQSNGYQKTTELNEADVVLLTTCSIRNRAESKIWDKLKRLKAFKVKENRKDLKIGILGCMAERLKTKVFEIDKTVDLVAGPDSYKDLPRLLALTRNDQKAVNVLLSLDETYADVMPVRLNENDKTAFVSIMRGCDNMCTYCIVPFTRGKERSRPINSIIEEVKMLSDQGIKQITLLGQNVNSYRDTSCMNFFENASSTKTVEGFKTVYKPKMGGLRFDTLLDKVSQIDPEMRIRFTSPHPKDFPDEVLSLIQERSNICKCLHLPAQSGSTSVLERMRRGYTREAYLNLVEVVRAKLPNVALTTDIIIGFCGETEEDHEQTLELMRAVRYNFVFHFPYSMREKTTAHRRYEDDVPAEVKKRRVLDVSKEFRRIADEINKAQINQTQLVLVEGPSKKSEEFLASRNDGNTKVIFPSWSIPSHPGSKVTVPVKPGDYVAVRITEGNSQALKGVPLYHTTLSGFGGAIRCDEQVSDGSSDTPLENYSHNY